MGLKGKVDTEATLDHLSVGIVRRWLSSDSGMYCAITQYKHNRTYITKSHTDAHCIHSTCHRHMYVMCNSNSYPVTSTVPLLPTEYRVERLYPPWVNVPSHVIQEMTLGGSLTSWQALKVSTPSVHSWVSRSMWPRSSEEIVMDRQVGMWLKIWWNDVNPMAEEGWHLGIQYEVNSYLFFAQREMFISGNWYNTVTVILS